MTIQVNANEESPTKSVEERGDQHENDHIDDSPTPIKVCLRLRPMNKLETSRRSRNCITIHDDHKTVTVDSPVDGEKNDFSFQKVRAQLFIQHNIFAKNKSD